MSTSVESAGDCPCCGTDVSMTLNGYTDGIFSFGLNLGTNEIDVTQFTSGPAGDTLACRQEAFITVNSYCIMPGLSLGDTGIAWSADVCGSAISGTGTVVGIDIQADAKGVPVWAYRLKITGTISGL